MTDLRAVVVEDEPAARRRLLRLLSEAGVEVVGEAGDGTTAVRAIREQPDADVVFLDVEMPGMDAFDVIRTVGIEEMPAVVFVTAFDQYAVEAFRVHAVDYLLKPFDEQRLRETLDRLRERFQRSGRMNEKATVALGRVTDEMRQGRERLEQLIGESGRLAAERLLIRSDDAIHFIQVRDIEWIEADGNYVRVHTGGGHTHVLRRKIGELEKQLDDQRFLRVHRSTIVNLDAVQRLVPWYSGGYVVRLKSGHETKLSRGYAARLFERVGSDF
jgi:two-component system LytT family response regulator